MNVLLAHEWLARTGGSENVFEQMQCALPEADAVSLWNDDPERFPHVTETWMSRAPWRGRKALSLPLMPAAWRSVSLDGIDTVVASSHAFSHHLAGRAVRSGRNGFAYVHSPARYIWAPELDGRGTGTVGRLGRYPLRWIDRRAAHPSVRYVANSRFVAHRIRAAWGVESEIMYPPVDTERLTATSDWSVVVPDVEAELIDSLPQEFVLGASRLVEYKRLDAAIRVGEQLGLPVVLAGDGPFRRELETYANDAHVPVHFVGRLTDAGLYTLMQRTQLFVFMAVEDFGIMPVEAMALGARVLLRDTGGTREIADELGIESISNPDDSSQMETDAKSALATPAATPSDVAARFSQTRFRSDFSRLVLSTR